ncbi:flagellar motor switch protein FliG [Polystyrenella longa]|nr:flagellar motor switch protein FliG [Polystyrenella longa]
MDDIDKAAVLILSLDKPVAAEVLSLLPKHLVEAVTYRLAKMENISKEQQKTVFTEFYSMASESTQIGGGGMDFAGELLSQSLGDEHAAEILDNIKQSLSAVPFGFLHKAEAENLLAFISDEHPQTIALILSHLPAQLSAEVVSGLPSVKQMEVIRRVAHMEQTSPEVVSDIEASLESRMTSLLSRHSEKAGGVPMVAQILNVTDRTTNKMILEKLEEEDVDLAEEIKRLMFVFDDLMKLDSKAIQALLKEVDNAQWAMSLKGASDQIKDKVLGNLSQRAADLLREEMEFLGPVKLSDVEAMQQQIVDVVRRLEDAGEIEVSANEGDRMIT